VKSKERKKNMFIINAFILTLISILDIFYYGLIAHVILGWLINFEVVNRHNKFVNTTWVFLSRLFEPVLYKIRSYIPPFNGLDFSALILFASIYFLKIILMQMITSR
jgi:YggT family protein